MEFSAKAYASFILQNIKSLDDIDHVGWRKQTSVYSAVCIHFGRSNISKNRWFFHSFWQRNKMGVREIVLSELEKRGNMDSLKCEETNEPQVNLDSNKEIQGAKYTDCKIIMDTINIDSNTWNSIFDTDYHRTNIRSLCAHVVMPCSLKFTSTRRNKSSAVSYMICPHLGCRSFKFVIKKDTTNTENAFGILYTDRLNYFHKDKLKIQLRGDDREQAKKILLHEEYSTFHKRMASNKSLKSDKIEKVYSNSVLWKVRSEARASSDFHADDIEDVCLMQKNQETLEASETFIQNVSLPFTIHTYSIPQVNVALGARKNGTLPILHWDATCSVVRQLKNYTKTVYYYSGVIEVNRKIIPIMDFISSFHETKDIHVFLTNFRKFTESYCKRWPIFSTVVCNFSLTMISSVVISWNGMTVNEYIETAYDWALKKSQPQDKIIPLICCAHFLKIVLSESLKLSHNSYAVQIFIEVIGAIICAPNFDYITRILRHFFVLLLSKYKTPEVEVSFQNIQSLIKCNKDDNPVFNSNILTSIEMIDFSILPDFMEKENFCKSNSFYNFFSTLSSDILTDSNAKVCEKNPLYSLDLHKLILQNYIPYLPFWSCFLIPNCSYVCNSPIEKSFRYMKVVLLNRVHNTKVGRFIRKLKNHIFALCKEIQG